MDLIALFKKSVKDPLHFSHLFVIFVTVFIFLIIGLCLFTIISTTVNSLNQKSACDRITNKNISGAASNQEDLVYTLDYAGNSQCFLSAFVAWKDLNAKIDFWLYDPDGNVKIIEPRENQTYNIIFADAPVNQGTWRLVLKTDSATAIGFQGEIQVK